MRQIWKTLAFATVGVLALWGGGSAFAGEVVAFDAGQFKAAQAVGKSIVVDVSATWCPTCAAQKPIIEQLAALPDFEDVTVFHVDFDSQKDVVRSLGAFMQSTLIAYKGTDETDRSIGDTDAESIKLLFQSSTRE